MLRSYFCIHWQNFKPKRPNVFGKKISWHTRGLQLNYFIHQKPCPFPQPFQLLKRHCFWPLCCPACMHRCKCIYVLDICGCK
jgi:hypothetical protein